jgi:tetratricopeptide (TPR) repeat protein
LDEFKYRAFISYSHRDTRWADWLHKGLESYRPPKQLVGTATPHGIVPKRVSPVFRDREELSSATDLGEVLNAALRNSACQIIVCSPNSAQSHWVNEEILAFKRLGREDRIFCLIVGGEPNATDMPGREAEECFPPAARFRLGPDGQLSDARTEPIASDARPGKDGRQNAKLKIIAGLLAVGFDSLRRREQQRRNRRLFVVACASVAGMVVTSGLAGYALIQRAAAQRQTLRAEQEARTATETTRFLVDLFKISDPGEARGNTVTAREMLDKGAARVDRELAAQPAIQATLMDTLGTVYEGLGLYPQARPLLDRAVQERRRLDGDGGGEPLALSNSLDHRGDLEFLQAEFASAEKDYLEAIRIDSLRPTDRNSRIALANALHGLGFLLANEGRYADAERDLREALARQRALYGDVHPDIARTLKDLARALADAGELNQALPIMQSAVAMQRRLRGAEPHPDLAEAINDLALLQRRRGDFSDAAANYVEALALKRRLYGERHPEIASGLENLAGALQDKGDLAGAESNYRLALSMNRELLGNDHPNVARTLHNLASLQYDRGETEAALATEGESLAIYRKVYPDGHRRLAFTLNTLGFWLALAGRYPDAEHDVTEALDMRRRLLGDKHPDVASSLVTLAHLDVAERKYADAVDAARSAAQIYTASFSATHWRTAFAESAEGAALSGMGRYGEAEPLLARSNEILNKAADAPQIARQLSARYLDLLHRHAKSAGSSGDH